MTERYRRASESGTNTRDARVNTHFVRVNTDVLESLGVVEHIQFGRSNHGRQFEYQRVAILDDGEIGPIID